MVKDEEKQIEIIPVKIDRLNKIKANLELQNKQFEEQIEVNKEFILLCDAALEKENAH